MFARVACVFLIPSATAYADTLATPRISCGIENTAGTTLLTAKAKGSDTPVRFRIDWHAGNETPEGFLNHPAKPNRLTSTHRLGRTTITRTILVSESADCILLHVQADQPGAIHFTARFVSGDPVEIHDRRQIVLTGKGIHARSWIIPFESDVSDDGKNISLSGEGEALIILNLTADPVKSPVSRTFVRLGEKYDPGRTPPDPHLIWQGMGEEQERGRAAEGERQ